MPRRSIALCLSFVGSLVGSIYVAMMFGCFTHEVLGHGLAAIVVGGKFRMFYLDPAAHGRAWYTGVPPELDWIPLWSGIAVNLVVGVLTIGVTRLGTFKSSHIRLALVALAATNSGQAIGYSLQGALSGNGDAASLATDVHGGLHVLLVCALAVAYLLLIDWAIRRFVVFVDEQFNPADRQARRRWFVGTVIAPVAILILARPPSTVFSPIVDWVSRAGILLIVSAWGLFRCRTPISVEGRSRPMGWRGAVGWLVGAAAMATAAVVWTSKGVHVEW